MATGGWYKCGIAVMGTYERFFGDVQYTKHRVLASRHASYAGRPGLKPQGYPTEVPLGLRSALASRRSSDITRCAQNESERGAAQINRFSWLGTAERIRENRFAAGCRQRVTLKVEKLLAGGDAGIADVQTSIISKLRTGCEYQDVVSEMG